MIYFKIKLLTKDGGNQFIELLFWVDIINRPVYGAKGRKYNTNKCIN